MGEGYELVGGPRGPLAFFVATGIRQRMGHDRSGSPPPSWSREVTWQDLTQEVSYEFKALGHYETWEGLVDGTRSRAVRSLGDGTFRFHDSPVAVYKGWLKENEFDVEDAEAVERERVRLEHRRAFRISEEKRQNELRETPQVRRERFLLERARRREAAPRRCVICRRPFDAFGKQYNKQKVCSQTCRYRFEHRRKQRVDFQNRLRRGHGIRCLFCGNRFIPKSTVNLQKFCCTEHRLRFRKKRTARRVQNQAQRAHCARCGNRFTVTRTNYHRKRFCKHACAVAAWREKKSPKESRVLKCLWCEAEFTPKKNSAKAGSSNAPKFCCRKHKAAYQTQQLKMRTPPPSLTLCRWCNAPFEPPRGRARAGTKTAPRFCCPEHRKKFHNNKGWHVIVQIQQSEDRCSSP